MSFNVLSSVSFARFEITTRQYVMTGTFNGDEDFMKIAQEQWKIKQNLVKNGVTTTEKVHIEYVTEGVSWGLVAPILLICLFLLGVALCLYWHSWREKRRLSFNRRSNSPNRFVHGSREGVDSQSSTQSSVPRLINIAERNVVNAGKKGQSVNYTAMEEATLRLMPSSMKVPVPRVRPFDTDVDEMSAMIPVCMENQQPARRLHHIAYRTSQPSTSSSQQTRGSESPVHDNTIDGSEISDGLYRRYENMQKSPYFPNNNTPVAEDETDSYPSSTNNSNSGPTSISVSLPVIPKQKGVIRTEHYIKRQCSRVLTPAATMQEALSYPEISIAHRRKRSNSWVPSGSSSYTDTESLSLPSSISRYHQSRILTSANSTNVPLTSSHVFSPREFVLASSIDSSENNYSDNTSLFPNVGSSIDSRSLPTTTQVSSSTNESPTEELVISPEQPYPHQSLPMTDYSASPSKGNSFTGDHCVGNNSYVADLFRSWSVTAELDYSCTTNTNSGLGTGAPGHKDSAPVWENYAPAVIESSFSDNNVASTSISLRDLNHNEVAVVTIPVHAVKIDGPVLRDKQYWL